MGIITREKDTKFLGIDITSKHKGICMISRKKNIS
jgi:hypothetical protein